MIKINRSCASPALLVFVTAVIENFNITLVTQTLKRDEKQFELAGVLVIGVNWKIQFVMLKIDIC